MSSGKGLTLVKTTLLPGQERLIVVASLPTSPSCDVTANIPIGESNSVGLTFTEKIVMCNYCNQVYSESRGLPVIGQTNSACLTFTKKIAFGLVVCSEKSVF